jgi:nucleoside-diphosphate-sugar epimerase
MASPPAPQFSYPLSPPSPDQTKANGSRRILITGVNGYIASHIAYLLLRRGYTVLGTSRSPTTLEKLKANPTLAQYTRSSDPNTPPRLQHITIPDITLPGAFDEAVRNTDAIIHTASPVTFNLTSVDAFFLPAVSGVKSLLSSAYHENKDHKGHIKSFIQLSSIAAVVDKWRFPPLSEGGTENRAYTEADWNETGESVARASEAAHRDGKGPFLAPVAYGASKAAAERAMWTFVRECTAAADSGGKWLGPACTSINPGVVMGPPVTWPETPEKLNETLLPVWNIYTGNCKKAGRLPPQIGGASWCDVRDVAALHVWAVENPGVAGGERYLATNGKAPPQAVADVMRDVIFKDDAERREKIIVGEPGKGYVEDQWWPGDEPTVVATKAYKALGIEKFRPFEVMVRETVEAFTRRWQEH